MQERSIAGTEFGRWVKQRRKQLDLTQIELAESAGCSIDSVRKIEAGSLRPSRQLAELLAKSLKVEPESIAAFVAFARTGEGGQMLDKQESSLKVEQPSIFDSAFDSAEPPTNLPVALSPFIGREAEVARIHSLLWQSSVRLVTLMGPPGIGKTRTSIEAATRLLGDYPHGAFFVPLAPVTEPDRVWSTLARTLDLQESPGVPIFDTLQTYLRPRKILLVMDNFEQVMDASASLVNLMTMAPRLKVIVTSREALRVRGEKAMVMPLMGLPDLKDLPTPDKMMESDAVALFVQRAQDINIDFVLDTDNAPVIAAVCHKLDGLPLAIELAATRLEVLSPHELLSRLESRLSLLREGLRDLPPHQRTLRQAIDWSHDLLDAGEQAIFRRLAVFAGGFTLDAAEAVCAGEAADNNVFKGVSSLVSKSLLQRTADKGDSTRFGMLEAIREYATELLNAGADADEVRYKHASFYLELAKEAKQQLRGPNSITWRNKLENDQNNLYAALEWWVKYAEKATADDQTTWPAIEPLLVMAGSLGQFWSRHGHINEGQVWLRRALAVVDKLLASGVDSTQFDEATQIAWFGVLTDLGICLYFQGRYIEALEYHGRALPIAERLGDKIGIARALHSLGTVTQQLAYFDDALRYYRQSMAILNELGEKRFVSYALNGIATILHSLGDYKEAHATYSESLEISRALDDKLIVATIQCNLAMLDVALGEYDSAEARLEESLALHTVLGSREGIGRALREKGYLALSRGRYEDAKRFLNEGLVIHQDMQILEEFALNIGHQARLMLILGKMERATILTGAFTGLREAIQSPIAPSESEHYEEIIAETRRQLGPDRWKAAWAEGLELSKDIDALVEYVMK